MKKMIVGFFCFALVFQLQAQSVSDLLQKANILYKQFKEADALNAYERVLAQDSANLTALVKCTELSTSLGKKQADKDAKLKYFLASKTFADKTLATNGDSAEAYYAQALAYGNFSEIETEKRKVIEDVKQIKDNADKGLSINAQYGLLNYVEGKWHYEMLALNWFKKAALNTFYGKDIPKPDIDSAIYFMEKCRVQLPYFVQNYFDLSKAYALKNRPAQEMEILAKMVKLPNRMADDAALKEEGKKRLQALQ